MMTGAPMQGCGGRTRESGSCRGGHSHGKSTETEDVTRGCVHGRGRRGKRMWSERSAIGSDHTFANEMLRPSVKCFSKNNHSKTS